MATWLHLTVVLFVMTMAVLPSPICGLLCECTADCPDGSDMCDAGDNGACYSQKITDISGQRNVLRKGCVADAQSVICAYRDSGAHENICCDNKDFCNKEHFIEPEVSEVSCECVGARKCKNQRCSLNNGKHSCYTTIRRLGSIITYKRGCKKNCEEFHNQDERTTCCRGNLCNNETIPDVWPSPSPSSETTTPPESPSTQETTDDKTNEILIIPSTKGPTPPTEDPETPLDRRINIQLTCHCSQCIGGSTCVANYACARYSMGGVVVTSCVNGESGEFSCKNKTSFNLNCCYKDHCNRPSSPPTTGPPCDDEDTEQSGCGPVIITSTPSTTRTTSSRAATMASSATATPTSTARASPPVGREKETEDTDQETVIVFYMFIVLLCLCVVIMVAVLIVCGIIIYYYRNLITKQTLSSATVLESSIKEKSFTSSSPS